MVRSLIFSSYSILKIKLRLWRIRHRVPLSVNCFETTPSRLINYFIFVGPGFIWHANTIPDLGLETPGLIWDSRLMAWPGTRDTNIDLGIETPGLTWNLKHHALPGPRETRHVRGLERQHDSPGIWDNKPALGLKIPNLTWASRH